MKKILSFVLFGDRERYWASLPCVLISNILVHSTFILRFYVHKQSVPEWVLQFLQETARIHSAVEIELIDASCIGTELTLWRLKPLWEHNIDVVFCRDLDAMLTTDEVKSMYHFLALSQYVSHSIRSYVCHTVPFLAGLCGFRINETLNRIRSVFPTFDSLINKTAQLYPAGEWGCDQFILRDFFTTPLAQTVLDCPQRDAPISIGGYHPTVCLPNAYESVELSAIQRTVLDFTSTLSGFAGNACIIRADKFYTLADLTKEEPITQTIKQIFLNDTNLRERYGIDPCLL